jgi:hypothetical protein
MTPRDKTIKMFMIAKINYSLSFMLVLRSNDAVIVDFFCNFYALEVKDPTLSVFSALKPYLINVAVSFYSKSERSLNVCIF